MANRPFRIGRLAPAECTPPERRRVHRMHALLLGIGVLSAVDLVLTLAHLRSVGLLEANPFAAWIMRASGSAAAVAAFKTASTAACLLLLHGYRRERTAEVAAWSGLAVLVALGFQWHAYEGAMRHHGPELLALQAIESEWITVD